MTIACYNNHDTMHNCEHFLAGSGEAGFKEAKSDTKEQSEVMK